MKRLTAFFTAICAICVLLTGCGDDGTGKGFRLPISGEPAQLDPQIATDTAAVTVLSSLFEGLTALNDDGTPVPAAAEWTVSDDGLTYTFTLRDSYWSTQNTKDEQPWNEPLPVTADDFLFGIARAVSPDTRSPWAEQLDIIAGAKDIRQGGADIDTLGVRVIDDKHLTVTLTAPDGDLPALLATPACFPCHRAFFTSTAGRYGLEKNSLLSNGPFVLTAWNHGQSILLNKNENYHAAADISPAAVRFVMDAEENLTALTDGTLDAVPLTAEEVSAAADAGITTVTLRDSVRGVWFNTQNSVLAEENIRRALRDSVEWGTVYEYLTAVGEPPATGIVPPGSTIDGEPYRTEENAVRLSADVEKAAEEWQAGLTALYPEKKALAAPALTVLAADDEVSANLARYLLQSWQKNLNFYGQLELVSASALARRVAGGNYQIAIYTARGAGRSPLENMAVFAAGDPANLSRLTDATVDAAIAAAPTEREELAALERLLCDRAPMLPMSFPARVYGIAPHIEGLTVRPFDGGRGGAPYGFTGAKKYDD